MKRIIALLAGVSVLGVMSGMAQGTLNFINSAATAVTGTTGAKLGAGYTAELLWGTSESTINNVGGTATFYTVAALNGVFQGGGILTFTGTAAGDKPWVTIRVWDNTKGATWATALSSASVANPVAMGSYTWQLTAGLGGPGTPPVTPPNVAQAGFQSFQLANVVPEPATYALLALGAAALMLRRRK